MKPDLDARAPSGRVPERNPGGGVLLLAGTPIGDSRYVSGALRDALLEADIIAAEDTRKFADLCRRAGIEHSASVTSFFEGNETERLPGLLKALAGGARVVLVTDAGMPAISDPGFRLVSGCIEAGLRVSAVPGPSAVLTALAVSGLATDRFCFEGFLPRKAAARRSRMMGLRGEERTMVFFEAPHRVGAFLSDAVACFGGDRRGAICRELTKKHEEVVRDRLEALLAWTEEGVRGEVTVVIEGAHKESWEMQELVGEVARLREDGEKLSVAVARVAGAHGANRRELYDAVRTR